MINIRTSVHTPDGWGVPMVKDIIVIYQQMKLFWF